MTSKIKLKEIFEAQGQYGAFYTGGSVAWSPDASLIYCQNGSRINVVSVSTVSVTASLGIESDDDIEADLIYRFALNDDGTLLISAHKSGLLRLWNTETGKLKKMWKSLHTGPVSTLAFSPKGGAIATGGSDSLIRLWDAELQVCKGTLRGCEGVVSLLTFDPTGDFVIGAGSDAKINCWQTSARKLVKQFASHFSSVTSVTFQDKFMVSSGRDKVIILWNFEEAKIVRTIPVYEAVEEVIFLTPGTVFNGSAIQELCVATAGEEGIIKVWDVQRSRILYKQEESFISKAAEEGGLAVTYMLHNQANSQLAVVSVDHNIIIHDIENFRCVKQLVGFSDEILDLTLFNKNKFLAMATNSKDIKLYDTETMNCKLLRGHTDIVLAVAARGNILITSSKDCAIKVWRIDGIDNVTLLGTGTRHTLAVGAIDLSSSEDFFVSGSQDKCIKLWKIPSEPTKTLLCVTTQLAHEKDINSIAVAPNNKLIATGSQDKMAKLWDASNLSLVGVLRGHTRGVWSVTFSMTDQVLLTTATDCTLRLWSLTELNCLKSFEGHESSVLRANFISGGMQILSTGADGLVKLWDVKTSECKQTLDKHESRIWAMATSNFDDSVFYTGGADSQLIKWKDVTAERRDEELRQAQEIALEEQQLSNLMQQKKMSKALRMALKLDRPHTSLKIINAIIKNQEQDELEATIVGLNDALKESLLRHASNWNTNSRNCRPAQLVVNILMTDILMKKLKITGMSKLLEDTIPYTERHFKRMTEYLKDIKYIEYTLKCMQPHTQTVEEEKGIKMEESSDDGDSDVENKFKNSIDVDEEMKEHAEDMNIL